MHKSMDQHRDVGAKTLDVVLHWKSYPSNEQVEALCLFHSLDASATKSLLIPLYQSFVRISSEILSNRTLIRLLSLAMIRLFSHSEKQGTALKLVGEIVKSPLSGDLSYSLVQTFSELLSLAKGEDGFLNAKEDVVLLGNTQVRFASLDVLHGTNLLFHVVKVSEKYLRKERGENSMCKAMIGAVSAAAEKAINVFFLVVTHISSVASGEGGTQIVLEDIPAAEVVYHVAKLLGICVVSNCSFIGQIETASFINNQGDRVLNVPSSAKAKARLNLISSPPLVWMHLLKHAFRHVSLREVNFVAECVSVQLETLFRFSAGGVSGKSYGEAWITAEGLVVATKRINHSAKSTVVGLGSFLPRIIEASKLRPDEEHVIRCLSSLLNAVTPEEVAAMLETCQDWRQRLSNILSITEHYVKQLDGLLKDSDTDQSLYAAQLLVQQISVVKVWISRTKDWFLDVVERGNRLTSEMLERLYIQLLSFFRRHTHTIISFLSRSRRSWQCDLTMSSSFALKELCAEIKYCEDNVFPDSKMDGFSANFQDFCLQLGMALCSVTIYSGSEIPGQYLLELYFSKVQGSSQPSDIVMDVSSCAHELFLRLGDMRALCANVKHLHETSSILREKISYAPSFGPLVWMPYLALLTSWSKILVMSSVANMGTIHEMDYADACLRLWSFFEGCGLSQIGHYYLDKLSKFHAKKLNYVEAALTYLRHGKQKKYLGDLKTFWSLMTAAMEYFVKGGDARGALAICLSLLEEPDLEQKKSLLHRAAALSKELDRESGSTNNVRYCVVVFYGKDCGYLNGQFHIYRLYCDRESETFLLSHLLNTFSNSRAAPLDDVYMIFMEKGIPPEFLQMPGFHIAVLPVKQARNGGDNPLNNVNLYERTSLFIVDTSYVPAKVEETAEIVRMYTSVDGILSDTEDEKLKAKHEEFLKLCAPVAFSTMSTIQASSKSLRDGAYLPDVSRRKTATMTEIASMKK